MPFYEIANLDGKSPKKYWEIIADKLTKAGFSWGCSSLVDSTGRMLFTADAYARNGRRFIILSDERLSAFSELERVTGLSLGEKGHHSSVNSARWLGC
jgi:hypothetical protein